MKKNSKTLKSIILKHGCDEPDQGCEVMAVRFKTKKAARSALLGLLRAKAEKDYSALVAERNLLATGKARLCVSMKGGDISFDAILGDDLEVNRLLVSTTAAVFRDVAICVARECEEGVH